MPMLDVVIWTMMQTMTVESSGLLYAAGFVAWGLANAAVAFTATRLVMRARGLIASDLRARALEAVLRRPIHEDPLLLSRKLGDNPDVVGATVETVLQTLGSLATGLASLASSMLLFSWPMTLAMIALVPCMILWGRYTTRPVGDLGERAQLARQRAQAFLTDRLLGGRVVWSFGAEAREADEYRRLQAEADALSAACTALLSGSANAYTVGLGVIYGAGVCIGMHLGVPPAKIFGALFTITNAGMSLSGVATLQAELDRALPQLRALWELIDQPPQPSREAGGTALRGVDFRLLRGIELPEVRPGETVALTGPSGCGKSTLLALLQGFEQPAQGLVESTLGPGETIGFVPPDAQLLAGDVRSNLRLGCPAASDAQLRRTLGALGLADLSLDADAATLSSGQKQRVALARAVLARPALLLLDEFTSALDADTEERVLDWLATAHPRLRVVMTAHRPAAIARASRVIDLKGMH